MKPEYWTRRLRLIRLLAARDVRLEPTHNPYMPEDLSTLCTAQPRGL